MFSACGSLEGVSSTKGFAQLLKVYIKHEIVEDGLEKDVYEVEEDYGP